MLKKGYLFATRFYPTIHHNKKNIKRFFKEFSKVCNELPRLDDTEALIKYLDGNIRSGKY